MRREAAALGALVACGLAPEPPRPCSTAAEVAAAEADCAARQARARAEAYAEQGLEEVASELVSTDPHRWQGVPEWTVADGLVVGRESLVPCGGSLPPQPFARQASGELVAVREYGSVEVVPLTVCDCVRGGSSCGVAPMPMRPAWRLAAGATFGGVVDLTYPRCDVVTTPWIFAECPPPEPDVP